MSDVMFRKEGHVAHVRLNRPAGLNAITPEMDGLLSDAWATINDDPDIWNHGQKNYEQADERREV